MHVVKASAKRLLTGLTAAATLFGLGLTTFTNPPTAKAADPKPAYATARITKLADGTGHGTSAQTFINSRNGFATGDDSPSDGVVSSGDTVSYEVALSFTAASKREVNVTWDLADAPYLKGGMVACVSGQQVTAKKNGSGCTYTVPAGAVETITQPLTLTAKDTDGLVKTDQTPKVTVARKDGGSVAYRTDTVTVVSAPAADLVVDNGGYPDKNYRRERRTTWVSSGTATGYFDLKVKPLAYPGYATTHGASTTGAWSASVDVSHFPNGTAWTLDGTNPLEVTNGNIRIENHTGNATLKWSIPAESLASIKEGAVATYDIQITPDENSFSVGEGADALQNMGDGGEPGRGHGKDTASSEDSEGAVDGYPYPNNDWSRAIIERFEHYESNKPSVTYSKTLERPYTAGKTIFDTESLTFDKAKGTTGISHYGTGDEVATGTQIRTIIDSNIFKTELLDDATALTLTDTWDTSEQVYDGGLQLVTDDGQPLDPSMYKVQWTDKTGKDATWHDGEPDGENKAVAIRVVIQAEALRRDGGVTAPSVSFITRITADVSRGNVRCDDTATGTLTGASGSSSASVADYVWAVAPGDPVADITNNVTVMDADGRQREGNMGQPGDTAKYSLTPSIDNIQLSGTSLTPTVTIPYPAGLIDPTCDSGDWKLTISGTGKNRKLVFTAPTKDGKLTPRLGSYGGATLPVITWHATVGNLASGTISAAASFQYVTDPNGIVPSQTAVSLVATASFTVSDIATTSGVLNANQAKVEIGDPMSWTFNTYAKGSDRSGKADFMLRLPSNDDSVMLGEDNTGLDGSWAEYERGSSAYHGTYKLTDPVQLNAENSSQTTVMYSTTVKWTDDPADYTWKSWDQL